MQRAHPRRHLAPAGMVAVLALAATACGDDGKATTAGPSTATAPAAVEVVATDYAFQLGSAKVPAGLVALSLTNKGAENHHLTLLRVNDATDADDVVAGRRKGDGSVEARTTAVGGPNGVAPGAKGTVTVDLKPGSYVMVCHIPSPRDQVGHAEKAMVASFTVSGPAAAAAATASAVKGTITIAKGGYQVPAGLVTGSYRVQNDFDQPAEAGLVRLRPGATAKDVLAFFSGQAPPGPPPFSSAGGVTTLAPRSSAVVDLELTQGTYALLSFSPDMTAGGAPQFLTGLITELSVT